jgi:nucleoid-associated protein YgaU
MTEKKSQSQLPVWITFALLIITIVAAYAYQSSKAVKVLNPSAVDQDKVNSTAQVQKPMSEPANDLTLEEAPISEDSANLSTEPKTVRDTEISPKVVESEPEEEKPLKILVLETVRVETDGTVVMSGTGLPSQQIKILLDDDIIETVTAGERGEFVAVFDIPYSEKIRVLSLESYLDSVAVYSQQQVIISPSQIEAPIVAAQVDTSQETKTELEQGSVSQEAVSEQKNTVSEAQEISKAQNNNQEVGEVKEPAPGVATENIQGEATQAAKKALPFVQEIKTDLEPVDIVGTTEETNIAPETIGGSAPSVEKKIKENVSISAMAKTDTSTNQQRASSATSPIESSTPKDEASQATVPQITRIDEAEAEPDPAETKEQAKDATASVEALTPIVEKTPDSEKAPVVMIADDDGVRVVQPDTAKKESDVALDTISYDDEGDVALAGRGQPSGFVRIYLDNTPISTASMDGTGQWNTALSEIDPGIYTLRVDQLDPTGQVSSRLETPFKRESIETLQSQLLALEEPARINVVTVQPGNTLWAIARKRYGLGVLYVRVFEANRDKIRDENLIYPGQTFELPD